MFVTELFLKTVGSILSHHHAHFISLMSTRYAFTNTHDAFCCYYCNSALTLPQSRVSSVHVVGRRSPAHASWTNKVCPSTKQNRAKNL